MLKSPLSPDMHQKSNALKGEVVPEEEGPESQDDQAGYLSLFLVVVYLLIVLGLATSAILYMTLGHLPAEVTEIRIGLMSAAIGAVGGCLYCLRAVYVNRCVRNQWTHRWIPWYLIRPIVSVCCGGISFLFLKAGLLVLESGTKSDASEIGFYALALVAGLNVDKFVAKIEDVAQAVWGIDKSRSRADVGRGENDTKTAASKSVVNEETTRNE